MSKSKKSKRNGGSTAQAAGARRVPRWPILGLGVATVAIGGFWWSKGLHARASSVASSAVATSIANELVPAPSSSAFASTVPNQAQPPRPAPEGMVWIPGGEFSMGCQVPSDSLCSMATVTSANDAQPIHRVYVNGFWMDATDVTNEKFEEFVKATGYVTIAERTPTKEEFPTAPPENLVAGSVVFTPFSPNPVPGNPHAHAVHRANSL